MKTFKLPKRNLEQFLGSLTQYGELHVPQKRGEKSYVFSKYENFESTELNYPRTILPLKKYFYEPKKTLFKFSEEEGYTLDLESVDKKYVIFGVHPYDIKALKLFDTVFEGEYYDSHYFDMRKNVAIIGIDHIPDELCFSASVDADFVNDGFDLFLYDIDDYYVVKIGTSLGYDMVNGVNDLFEAIDKQSKDNFSKKIKDKKNQFGKSLDTTELSLLLDINRESEVWKEIGDKCLSCGACSVVCPTCYCYNVFDEINLLDVKNGERKREWDSCLFKDHSLMAGGLNPRGDRPSRIRNRIYHKFYGFMGDYSKISCVGCGRCTEVCPAGIDFIDAIKKVKGEDNGSSKK